LATTDPLEKQGRATSSRATSTTIACADMAATMRSGAISGTIGYLAAPQLPNRETESGGRMYTILEADRKGYGAADSQIVLARHIDITSASLCGNL
jgi:hypothetical protein